MNIYDSHTHLNHEELFLDWQSYLASFVQAGGKALVNAGANEIYNQNALVIAKESKKLFSECLVKLALGYHPCDVSTIQESLPEAIEKLKKQIKENSDEVVAVGECGIDLHFEKETLELQKKYFDAQCLLARELKLPIMIHSRDAFDETFEILKNYPDLKVYFHCRGYDEKEIKILMEYFDQIFFGFCGNVSYPKAENLRNSLRALPLERVLIETDAPYLAPQEIRGQINQPQNVEKIARFMAKILNQTENSLWEQVEKNFYSLYHI